MLAIYSLGDEVIERVPTPLRVRHPFAPIPRLDGFGASSDCPSGYAYDPIEQQCVKQVSIRTAQTAMVARSELTPSNTTPPASVQTVQVGPTSTPKPENGELIVDQIPWIAPPTPLYKKGWFWGALAAATVATGGIIFAVARKRD